MKFQSFIFSSVLTSCVTAAATNNSFNANANASSSSIASSVHTPIEYDGYTFNSDKIPFDKIIDKINHPSVYNEILSAEKNIATMCKRLPIDETTKKIRSKYCEPANKNILMRLISPAYETFRVMKYLHVTAHGKPWFLNGTTDATCHLKFSNGPLTVAYKLDFQNFSLTLPENAKPTHSYNAERPTADGSAKLTCEYHHADIPSFAYYLSRSVDRLFTPTTNQTAQMIPPRQQKEPHYVNVKPNTNQNAKPCSKSNPRARIQAVRRALVQFALKARFAYKVFVRLVLLNLIVLFFGGLIYFFVTPAPNSSRYQKVAIWIITLPFAIALKLTLKFNKWSFGCYKGYQAGSQLSKDIDRCYNLGTAAAYLVLCDGELPEEDLKRTHDGLLSAAKNLRNGFSKGINLETLVKTFQSAITTLGNDYLSKAHKMQLKCPEIMETLDELIEESKKLKLTC